METTGDAAGFWDKRADGYAKKPVKDPESYEKTLDRTRKHLSAGHRILEVGCGTGTTALLLAPGAGRITATDVSPRMIEIARAKAATRGVENVDFHPGTLFDADLEPGSFDVVLAFNLLHLLGDVPAAARRAGELLAPGGLFISKTACLAEQTRLWGPVLRVLRLLGIAPLVRCLTIAELEDAITGAGFGIVETGVFPASPPSRFVVARKR